MASIEEVGRGAEWLKKAAYGGLMFGAVGLAAHKVHPMRPLKEAILEQATGDPFADRKLLSASINTSLADAFMPGYMRNDVESLENHYINTGPASFYDPSYLGYKNSAPSGSIVMGLYNNRLK